MKQKLKIVKLPNVSKGNITHKSPPSNHANVKMKNYCGICRYCGHEKRF